MLRRHGFDLIVTSVCLSLLGFFGWHAVNGKRSFANQEIIIAEVSQLEEKRDRIRARREALESRVSLLRPENLDPDMLEEMSRRMLGFTRANEIVVND
jgi:cell division protein FtsB